MNKVAAVLDARAPQVGNMFDALCDRRVAEGDVSPVLLTVPAEGRVIVGSKGLDVGERVRVSSRRV